MKSDTQLRAIPTNIITGFLGVGKTSAILHLLRHKPSQERWAVLVNEFGEIGVDGALFEGRHTSEQGIFIKEVPGGCMCCTAGLPMQIALNQLLSAAKPDRLLIEPTGLGHPQEVLETLSSGYYRDVLSLQKIITLVDARKLSDERYTLHRTFNQQIAVADTIVGNKEALYQAADKVAFTQYVTQHGQRNARILCTNQGEIDVSELDGATNMSFQQATHHPHQNDINLDAQEMPESGVVRALNEGEGFKSVGWKFAPSKVFDRQKLRAFLSGIQAERMKAVFITRDGVFGYNLTPDALTELTLDECMESRIEIISAQLDDQLDVQLMACMIDY